MQNFALKVKLAFYAFFFCKAIFCITGPLGSLRSQHLYANESHGFQQGRISSTCQSPRNSRKLIGDSVTSALTWGTANRRQDAYKRDLAPPTRTPTQRHANATARKSKNKQTRTQTRTRTHTHTQPHTHATAQ